MPGKKKHGKRRRPLDSDEEDNTLDSKYNYVEHIMALKAENEKLEAINAQKKRKRSKKKKRMDVLLPHSIEKLADCNGNQSELSSVATDTAVACKKLCSNTNNAAVKNLNNITNGFNYCGKKAKNEANNYVRTNCNNFANGHKKVNIHPFNRTGNKNFTPSSSNQAKINNINIFKQRQRLPIFPVRDEIVQELVKHETIIVIGETGSGKTTQIPQFIHEKQLDHEGAICITQPRRVAAITIANRVAEEMNTEIGNIVGYSVRFEEASSHKTKLRYVTDGMLLREALTDSMLCKYNWIILDEAHERSVNTDILFGVVKKAQKERKLKGKKSLHIIVMSATMDVDHFSSYFNNAHVIYIEGREHNIEVFQARKKQNDYTIACLSTMLKIHRETPDQEDILIFLTGQEEIESAVKLISYIAKDKRLVSCPKLKALPLYAALPYHKQLSVFCPSVPGERKIIVTTNIAETSVTIPGIRYVIDSGHAKVRTYNSISGFDDLKVCRISQAQAWQRSGRAGREAPGVCYRTYTNEEFEAMNMNTVPEILKTNLASVLLKLLAIGIKDVLNFDFIDKPPKENLKEAEKDLIDLKAVEVKDGVSCLTNLGRKMAAFPLEPRFAKLLICGPNFSCTEEMLTIIALLSSENIYVNPNDRKEVAREKRKKFAAYEGDHITLLNVYKAFEISTNKKVWCRKNFLNFRNLQYASEVRRQLKELCIKQGIPLFSCNQKPEPVLRCLISGLHKNIAKVITPRQYQTFHHVQQARIHPSSTLFRSSQHLILFTELVKTEKTYMHINSRVDASWLLEFDHNYFHWRVKMN